MLFCKEIISTWGIREFKAAAVPHYWLDPSGVCDALSGGAGRAKFVF